MLTVAKRKRPVSAFGVRLRAAREAAGWTQKDLASVADVHQVEISKYERGVTEPIFSTAVRLARALGVPVEELADAPPG